jgi:alpha-tubulin suppressor-like RCC1 family protein
VTAISVGEYSACAIVNGAAKCWGYNNDGQLGKGSTTNATSPVAVTGLTSGVTAISVGEYSACAIVNGFTDCWGYNADGQLGNGSTTNSSTSVLAIPGLENGVSYIFEVAAINAVGTGAYSNPSAAMTP